MRAIIYVKDKAVSRIIIRYGKHEQTTNTEEIAN
jgi:hypothetical protein